MPPPNAVAIEELIVELLPTLPEAPEPDELPPAPPAPGVLPWAGYFVKPFSGNPLSSKESLIKVGTIIADELLKAKENEKV